MLGDWEERYRYVIDLGRELTPLADADRTDANKVRGCASQVWLVTEHEGRGSAGVSAAIPTPTSCAALSPFLLRLYSERSSDDIAAFDAEGAFKQLGFAGALSQQRSNGLASMVERIRRDARAARA